MEHIVIIGNGISGITLARHIRKKSRNKITVISGESEHFFSRTALMYIYMGHMKYEHIKPYSDDFWVKNDIDLMQQWVAKIDTDAQMLHFQDNSAPLLYDKLIIATGSKTAKYGWPGQDLYGVLGLYSLQDLNSLEELSPKIKSAVIVGGGLIGIELAEMLYSRKIPATLLVREDSFWNNVLPSEESSMINEEIQEHHGITLKLANELDSINAGEGGTVKSVTTKSGETIACEFVGLTTGVIPNIDFIKSTNIEIEKGILVDEYLQTNIKNVYAIGDCAQLRSPLPHRRPMEQVWYTGRMMGETLACTLTGKPTSYKPGVWFNSAKFFNIEYQTYGNVTPKLPENESTFCWQAKAEKKLVRINFDSKTRVVTGTNTFGIRMRHEVWDKWLREKFTIDKVMSNLEKANFDPEFFKRHEKEIRKQFSESGL
jgi:NADPH-dependent 2,4-dienoyl-CoA reductase/sulfur reductase-like enzyme